MFAPVIAVVVAALTRVAPFLVAISGGASFIFNPIGTVVSYAWQLLVSPIGKWVVLAALVFGAFFYGDIRGHYKEHERMTAQNKQEIARAVAEANAARDEADKKFTAGRFSNRPSLVPGRVRHGSDGFARD